MVMALCEQWGAVPQGRRFTRGLSQRPECATGVRNSAKESKRQQRGSLLLRKVLECLLRAEQSQVQGSRWGLIPELSLCYGPGINSLTPISGNRVEWGRWARRAVIANRLTRVFSHFHFKVSTGKTQIFMKTVLLCRFAGAGIPSLGSWRCPYPPRKVFVALWCCSDWRKLCGEWRHAHRWAVAMDFFFPVRNLGQVSAMYTYLLIPGPG